MTLPIPVRAAFAACIVIAGSAGGQEHPSLLLDPAPITLTAHFEAPSAPASMQLAVRSVEAQIDAKREAEIAAPELPVWKLAIWRYLPSDPVRTLNSRVATDDDPFFTPEYLKLSARRLDYELQRFESSSRGVFGE